MLQSVMSVVMYVSSLSKIHTCIMFLKVFENTEPFFDISLPMPEETVCYIT